MELGAPGYRTRQSPRPSSPVRQAGRKVGRNSRAVNRKGNRVAGQTNKLSYLSGTAACRLTGLQGLVKDHIDINSELWDCDSLLLKNLRQIPIKEKQYNITRRFPFPRNIEQQFATPLPRCCIFRACEFVSSDRSSCTDDGLLSIYPPTFSEFPLMQLMLRVSL